MIIKTIVRKCFYGLKVDAVHRVPYYLLHGAGGESLLARCGGIRTECRLWHTSIFST